MKPNKRSIRRHHRQRIINKWIRRKKLLGDRLGWGTPNRLVETHTPCSCSMCGNPRKWFNKPTRQEIKSDYEERN